MNKKFNLLLISLCLVGCSDYNGDDIVNYSLNYGKKEDGTVEKIEWDSKKYEEDKKYNLNKYTLENKEEKNLDYDAELTFYLEDFELPLTLSFKFVTSPDKSKLYYYMTDCYSVDLGETHGYSTSLTFNELYTNSLKLEAMYDGDLSYVIKINALLRYGGWN